MVHKRTVFVYLLLLIVVAYIGAYSAERKKDTELNFELMKLAQRLQNTLQDYKSVPQMLQKSEALLTALRSPTVHSISTANEQLHQINNTLKADVSYLMTTDGLTIASSNYQTKGSFVGKNFSFRPYFKQAIAGIDSTYFALGSTSGKRGYYFASPLSDQKNNIGVIVVKVSLAFIEDMWKTPEFDYVISDSDGVIFVSSNVSWLYKTMYKLPLKQRNKIQQSLRYGDALLEPISQYGSMKELYESPITLFDNAGKQSWIVHSLQMPEWGWHIYSMEQHLAIWPEVMLYIVIYTLIMLLLYVIYLYRTKRSELQLHLKEMNIRLESRVHELTGDQQRTNSELQELVDHYRQTQTELQNIQTQLIQTTKLAVLGEFSAGLHHELAQPLQALQSYSSNCRKMLTLGKTDKLHQNLLDINEICKTMTDIIAKIKIFARRTNPEPRPTSLHEIITATLTIVRPKFEDMAINFEDLTSDVNIFCEPVLVEQVLVNLLNNALQALENTDNPLVRMTSTVKGDYLNLSVEDNGPMLTEEQITQIFDPFYTTKASGLGLGLTISQRIIESQNGKLSVKITKGGGLTFTIQLCLYKMRENNEFNINS
ncbi:MAG: sensor histidine kinase [Gammaproteobacteria bacterium]|nr:sensor histidine kinase [Gammaproteobacteria bacterium]